MHATSPVPAACCLRLLCCLQVAQGLTLQRLESLEHLAATGAAATTAAEPGVAAEAGVGQAGGVLVVASSLKKLQVGAGSCRLKYYAPNRLLCRTFDGSLTLYPSEACCALNQPEDIQ
jgi:hypothetical protein